MHYRYLFIVLFILFCRQAMAATFVVTSNADSGPGTLREALTLAAANDSTQTDFINFNLTDISEAGRTLNLKSQLPDVSSNLVIDGSTQTGAYFGVSTAKIALFFNPGNNGPLYGLSITNKHNVTILGLYLKYFKSSGPDSAGFNYRTGIYIVNSDNVIFGQALKGNVVIGFSQSFTTSYLPANNANYCSNITIKASFFSIDADGETLPVEQEQAVGLAYLTGSIKVGGTEIEGNLLANGVSISQQNSYAPYDTVTAHFYIRNNKIGVNFNVTKEILTSEGILASTVTPEGSNYLDIDDNVITGNAVFGQAIYPINMGRDINIRRNYIGTDKTRTKTFKTGGIFLYWCTGQVSIGSNDPADANYITNCVPVNVWPYTNARINKNSFYCPTYVQPMHYAGYGEFDVPQINITNISATAVSGTATPNSSIELFYDDKCGTCSPQTYFASTTADVNGNWKYTGSDIHGTIIASATYDKNTSDFTRTGINTDNVKVISACDDKGSITGAVPQSASDIRWVDEHGKTISTQADLIGVKPGKYKLVVKNGGCSDSTSYYEIQQRFVIDTTKIKKVQPSCNGVTGSISNIQFTYNDDQAPLINWIDASNKSWGNNLDVSNLPAGKYTLNIKSANQSCSKTYGPFTLINTTGPTIDDSKPNITNTNCGQSIGSIKNIIVNGGSGTRHFTWKNNLQQEVAYTQDLTNQPAGKYTMHVTDDTQCGDIISSTFEIKTDGVIVIDESAKTIQPATCEFNNGSIIGLTATGATIYNWYNSDNQVVSNRPDLDNAAPGSYYLVASNANGCSTQSTAFTIERTPRTIIGNTKVIKNATCGDNNGSITIIFQQQPAPTPQSFRWVNHATGANISTTTAPELHGLDAGVYDIYVTEQTGCEYLLASYQVVRVDGLYVMADNVQVGDDHCQTGTGSIKGINVNGATPLSFLWTDDNNNVVGNAPNLENITAGTYHIQITDGSGCTQGLVYTVYDKSEVIVPPSVTNLNLCTAGNALLVVNNVAGEYSYRLYDNADSPTPLNEQQNGRFAINVTGDRSYYISKLRGNCESARAEIKVKVGISTLNIANTFTPNGDGHNDYWKIDGIENSPQAVVQVFNRYGQKLFESKGYGQPFNGTFNGKALPTGTYYYIINLSKNCNLLSGSVTILR